MPLFGLRIFSEILIFSNTPSITKHIYMELISYLYSQANMFKKAASVERWHPQAVLLLWIYNHKFDYFCSIYRRYRLPI